MKEHEVELSRDHLERQAKCSPEAAIEEMIWNALDAGGNRVDVRFEENPIGGLTAIEVQDQGEGIPYSDLGRAFGTIGRSLKIDRRRNPEDRVFHGSEGRGRFKALVLGTHAHWRTTYRADGHLLTYDIHISRDKQKSFQVTDEAGPGSGPTGTTLRIEGIDQSTARLLSEGTRERLTERLALYLTDYPEVRVRYGGSYLDPRGLIKNLERYELPPTSESPRDAKLLTLA